MMANRTGTNENNMLSEEIPSVFLITAQKSLAPEKTRLKYFRPAKALSDNDTPGTKSKNAYAQPNKGTYEKTTTIARKGSARRKR